MSRRRSFLVFGLFPFSIAAVGLLTEDRCRKSGCGADASSCYFHHRVLPMHLEHFLEIRKRGEIVDDGVDYESDIEII